MKIDDAIATGDVLYDLAFALMDFWERDLHGEANALLNGYFTRGPEGNYAALAALMSAHLARGNEQIVWMLARGA